LNVDFIVIVRNQQFSIFLYLVIDILYLVKHCCLNWFLSLKKFMDWLILFILH